MSFDDLSRLTDRANTKMIERALNADKLPRSTERLARRENGHSSNHGPIDLDVVSREANVKLSGSQDLRSELVRRLVQMEVLNAQRGLARSGDDGGGDDGDDGGAAAGGASAPSAADQIFAQWFGEMQAQGLNKSEIEEHLIARIRAVRRGILGAGEERRLRRK